MSADEPVRPSDSESAPSDTASEAEPLPPADIVMLGEDDIAPMPAQMPSGSDMPPPPLPPPACPPPPPPYHEVVDPPGPVVRAPAVRGGRSRALAYYSTAHGRVTFYPGSGTFEARCTFPGHGDCRVTKTRNAPKGKKLLTNPHQGRLAACLVAWLETASADQVDSNAHRHVMPSWVARRAVRDRLKNAGPHAVALLGAERARMGHEPDSEPSDFPGFESD